MFVMRKNKTIAFFRYAPLYRSRIYELMNKKLNVDFLFCKDSAIKLQQMDYSILRNCYLSAVEKGKLESVHYETHISYKRLFSYQNIILAGNPKDLTVWLILILKSFFYNSSRIYLWTHGAYGNESILKRIIKRFFYKMSDGVLLYGNYAKKILVSKHIVPIDKLHVIYNSLDYDNQLILRNNQNISFIFREHFANDYFNIVIICRLTKRKQISLLIDAMALLANKNFDCNLTIIGDGEERGSLQEYVVSKNLSDRIWFYGACYDDNKTAEILYNADLCVSPGDIGLTAVHSMMFGTPVITHNDFTTQGPEFECIISGETGCFFEKNNPLDLAYKIKEWLLAFHERNVVREKCYHIVDSFYNPHVQIKILREILK